MSAEDDAFRAYMAEEVRQAVIRSHGALARVREAVIPASRNGWAAVAAGRITHDGSNYVLAAPAAVPGPIEHMSHDHLGLELLRELGVIELHADGRVTS